MKDASENIQRGDGMIAAIMPSSVRAELLNSLEDLISKARIAEHYATGTILEWPSRVTSRLDPRILDNFEHLLSYLGTWKKDLAHYESHFINTIKQHYVQENT